MTKHLSVVLPVHNEEKNIEHLYNELKESLKGIDYELVFVDDGSVDRSYFIMEQIASHNTHVKVVKLLSNYGQSTALAAGCDHATGENIVTMDSDLQHDPKDIISLIEPLSKGYHVVCGWRRKRGDSFVKKGMPSRFANFLVNKMLGIKLHDSVGGMKAFTRRVVEVVPMYGDMHRYLPVLAKWKGFRITERPVKVRERRAGKTHYKFNRLFKGFLDLMTVKFFISYSTRPFHIFAKIGFVSFMIGFCIGLYYVILKVFFGVYLMQEIASLILSVMLIVLGINFICFGFIADMISFDAISSKKRKVYLVEKVV
ncbi:glycosyltransferase [Candidatus Woesearchaeota archaeon CG10_big_fil_rev_8_21_14_0_10_36_11]|nr:MAG: glycosyltransferase [Candidatus Woesearchaeota archaeon CG10_big_fil_rev_8_21_14_0_10_36_11]